MKRSVTWLPHPWLNKSQSNSRVSNCFQFASVLYKWLKQLYSRLHNTHPLQTSYRKKFRVSYCVQSTLKLQQQFKARIPSKLTSASQQANSSSLSFHASRSKFLFRHQHKEERTTAKAVFVIPLRFVIIINIKRRELPPNVFVINIKRRKLFSSSSSP